MTIDLSFTQDPEWVKNRQMAWEGIEDSLAEGRTKKELEARRRYFFSGVKPTTALYPVEYIEYFPLPNQIGLGYVIGTFIDEKKVKDHQYRSMQLAFSQNLEHWPGLKLDDRLQLFKLAHGDTYNPSRKFPFLIGKETSYRDFTYNADGYFSVMTSRCATCFGSDEVNSLFWLDSTIVEYYLSIITKVDQMIFSLNVPEGQENKNVGSTTLKGTQSHLNRLMKLLINPEDSLRLQSHPRQAMNAMNLLRNYLDSAECPTALSDRWQWAKKEFAHE